jgi:hypothetical protein
MKCKLLIYIPLFLFFTSCVVQSPKYTTLDKVIALHMGMTKAQVEETLGVKPYSLKAYTDSGSVFIYVFRAPDRITFSVLTRPSNGFKSKGRYIQLEVSFSKKDKVTNISSCNVCPDYLESENSINISDFVTFFSVTLPVILIYIGLKKN